MPLNDNFLVEPDMNTVLTKLIPKYLHLMVYTALLDSIAPTTFTTNAALRSICSTISSADPA